MKNKDTHMSLDMQVRYASLREIAEIGASVSRLAKIVGEVHGRAEFETVTCDYKNCEGGFIRMPVVVCYSPVARGYFHYLFKLDNEGKFSPEVKKDARQLSREEFCVKYAEDPEPNMDGLLNRVR